MPTTKNIPAIADVTGDFVYARLQTGEDDDPDLLYAEGARRMGEAGEDLGGGQGAGRSARADPSSDAPVKPRDVFVYFITDGKVRAPHGAMAFMDA